MFLISLYHDMFQYTISLTVCQERGKGFKSGKFLFRGRKIPFFRRGGYYPPAYKIPNWYQTISHSKIYVSTKSQYKFFMYSREDDILPYYPVSTKT